MLFLKNVFGRFYGSLESLSFCSLAHCEPQCTSVLFDLECLPFPALSAPPPPPPPTPWQVELSIQRECMTHVWTPSTAFPWPPLWTSSSCVYTEDCLQKSQILTTSGKYVSDLRPFSRSFHKATVLLVLAWRVCFDSKRGGGALMALKIQLQLPESLVYFVHSFKVNEEITVFLLAW